MKQIFVWFALQRYCVYTKTTRNQSSVCLEAEEISKTVAPYISEHFHFSDLSFGIFKQATDQEQGNWNYIFKFYASKIGWPGPVWLARCPCRGGGGTRCSSPRSQSRECLSGKNTKILDTFYQQARLIKPRKVLDGIYEIYLITDRHFQVKSFF